MPQNPIVTAELTPLKALKPWDKNPRKNDAAVGRLASLIAVHGFINPIVASRDGVIRAGHTRYKAAKKLGMEQVPVIFIDFESEEHAAAYAISDNKSGEWAEWDIEVLAGLLKDLQISDVPLQDTGLSEDEISELMKEALMLAGHTDPDDAPSLPVEAKAVRGDMYILGAHRLLCGDATLIHEYHTLMGGDNADMVFTDPPYNVDYTGKTKDKLKLINDRFATAGSPFYEFLALALSSAFSCTKPGGAIYITHADSEGLTFRKAMIDSGWLMKQCIIWVKDTMVMGRQDYHWRHEPILYGWAVGAAHKWFGDRKQTTTWDIPRPKRSEVHPTMKPVALVEQALRNSSARKAIILDPFGGSGSTMIACEKTGRSCYMMELDPKYVDVIIERWQNYTGKEAKLEREERDDTSDPGSITSGDAPE